MTQIRKIITDFISENHSSQRSMKIVLISISIFLLTGFHPETKRLNFSLKNSTNLVLLDVKIELPETKIAYASLAPNSQTKWVKVKAAYSCGSIQFTDKKKRQYALSPKDYAGEKLICSGNLTYVIKSIDTLSKKIELDHILQPKINIR